MGVIDIIFFLMVPIYLMAPIIIIMGFCKILWLIIIILIGIFGNILNFILF